MTKIGRTELSDKTDQIDVISDVARSDYIEHYQSSPQIISPDGIASHLTRHSINDYSNLSQMTGLPEPKRRRVNWAPLFRSNINVAPVERPNTSQPESISDFAIACGLVANAEMHKHFLQNLSNITDRMPENNSKHNQAEDGTALEVRTLLATLVREISRTGAKLSQKTLNRWMNFFIMKFYLRYVRLLKKLVEELREKSDEAIDEYEADEIQRGDKA